MLTSRVTWLLSQLEIAKLRAFVQNWIFGFREYRKRFLVSVSGFGIHIIEFGLVCTKLICQTALAVRVWYKDDQNLVNCTLTLNFGTVSYESGIRDESG